MVRAQIPGDAYLNEKYPWDPTGWVTACCAAIEDQDRETALTCLELWDGVTGSLNVLLAGMKYGFLLIVKKIIRHVLGLPYVKHAMPYAVPWEELIECAVLTCRSIAVLKFIETEFLSDSHDGRDPRLIWCQAIEDFARITITDAVEKGDRWLAATCLELSPSLALDPSLIVAYRPPADLLWVIMSKIFNESKGRSFSALKMRQKSLRNLETITLFNKCRKLNANPTSRAMARIFIKRGLESFPSSGGLSPDAYEFIIYLRKKYGAGDEMKFRNAAN